MTDKIDDHDENTPLSPQVADRGIRNSRDFVDFMGALIADVVSGRIEPKVANAACVAGGHILKITKMHLDWAGQTDTPLPMPGEKRALGGSRNSSE